MPDTDTNDQLLDDIPTDELADFMAWREKVAGTNISDKTLLATDYLNHFNEIVMLIEMLPDMPDMIEECRMWQPKSYQDHFRDSGFSDRELAVEAYDHVPGKFRRPFQDSIAMLNQVVDHTLNRISSDIDGGDTEKLRLDCQSAVEMIQRLIQIMIGIIHGTAHVMAQDEIDVYLTAA